MIIGLLDVLKDVVTRFESANIDYFLVGSMASMYYGRPRFTRDVDLVARIKSRQVHQIEELFPLNEYYCPPKEILQDEVSRKGSFNLIHHKSGIKIDIVLDQETEFYRSEFERRKQIELAPGLEVFIASAEDVILKKLDYYREGESEKHLIDIREIVMTTKIDEEYLKIWVEELGLRVQWAKI
jgi:hypothetical protein